MKTKLKKLSETRVEISVTLDAKEMQEARLLAIKNLAKNAKIQGFRPGKAPMELVEKNIDQAALMDEELNIAVQNAIFPAFDGEKVQALAMPEISVLKFVPKEMMEFTLTTDIVPEVVVGDYKKLKTKKDVKKVTEKDIDDVVADIAKSHADKVKVERAVKKGDIVSINFVGKEDGRVFEGGSADKFELEIGSKQFIEGFEEGIIGHKKGDEFTLNLAFPKNYHAEAHAGKKVDFDVKILEVFEKKVAKIDDELAKKSGLKTVKELKEDIKKNLQARYDYTAEEKFKDELVAELVKNSKVSAPEVLVKDQMQMIRSDVERNIAPYGVKLEEYLEMTGEKFEEWEKEAKKAAEARVKASLVLQKVALAEKISVDDKLVEAKVAELRSVYAKSKDAVNSLKDPRVLTDLKNRMIIEKTLDRIVEINKK